jgi:LmbE family N-acetylglucosaminyl deacetylase
VSARRILLLVPHPDDEVVGCAAALRRAQAEGAACFALYLTTGVPAPEALWPWQRRRHAARVARRRAEALEAAARLGLEPLAFQPWPTRTLKSHLDEALALVEAAVAEHAIDAIWVPAWEGAHQDHDVANCLAARFSPRLPVREFAEYSFAGGEVRAQRFFAPNGSEEVILLDAAERRLKRECLALYRSERGNLRHIGATVESLRPLPTHDYARPPHEGRLFYQRFQWVPFRHPRIDFERPAAVSAALAEWLSEGPSRTRGSGERRRRA